MTLIFWTPPTCSTDTAGKSLAHLTFPLLHTSPTRTHVSCKRKGHHEKRQSKSTPWDKPLPYPLLPIKNLLNSKQPLEGQGEQSQGTERQQPEPWGKTHSTQRRVKLGQEHSFCVYPLICSSLPAHGAAGKSRVLNNHTKDIRISSGCHSSLAYIFLGKAQG